MLLEKDSFNNNTAIISKSVIDLKKPLQSPDDQDRVETFHLRLHTFALNDSGTSFFIFSLCNPQGRALACSRRSDSRAQR